MIARSHYAGPITKSAEAMFARAERRAGRSAARAGDGFARAARPISPARQALQRLGLTMSLIRQWEDAGVIAFERAKGRRVVNEAAVERLATVVQLRRAGFSIKEIVWISDTLPPPLPAMRRALQARQDHIETANSLARAAVSGMRAT